MNAAKSFIKRYGVLTVPLITMTFFGQFGWRPSQGSFKYVPYMMNTWLFFGFILVCFSNIHFTVMVLSSPKFNSLRKWSYVVYTSIIIVLFTMWLIILLKRNNLFCLLKHILYIRRQSLTKRNLLVILIIVTLLLAIVCYNSLLMERLSSEFDTDDKNSLMDYLLYILLLISNNSSWMLVLNICFLICVMAIILSREFKESFTHLEQHLKEDKILDMETFYATTERFREVTSVVNEMDEMFFGVVGVILTMSLACLCTAIYGVLGGHSPVIWYMGGILSTVTLLMLLQSLSSLNYQVSETTDMLQWYICINTTSYLCLTLDL